MYQEQLRQHEAILREAQKTSHNHAQAVTKLEMLSATRKQMESSNENSKMELAKTKVFKSSNSLFWRDECHINTMEES